MWWTLTSALATPALATTPEGEAAWRTLLASKQPTSTLTDCSTLGNEPLGQTVAALASRAVRVGGPHPILLDGDGPQNGWFVEVIATDLAVMFELSLPRDGVFEGVCHPLPGPIQGACAYDVGTPARRACTALPVQRCTVESVAKQVGASVSNLAFHTNAPCSFALSPAGGATTQK